MSVIPANCSRGGWFVLLISFTCLTEPRLWLSWFSLLPSATVVAVRYYFHKCVSRILSTGGGVHASWTHPRALPWTPLHPTRRSLQRTAHILLECILVIILCSRNLTEFNSINAGEMTLLKSWIKGWCLVNTNWNKYYSVEFCLPILFLA